MISYLMISAEERTIKHSNISLPSNSITDLGESEWLEAAPETGVWISSINPETSGSVPLSADYLKSTNAIEQTKLIQSALSTLEDRWLTYGQDHKQWLLQPFMTTDTFKIQALSSKFVLCITPTIGRTGMLDAMKTMPSTLLLFIWKNSILNGPPATHSTTIIPSHIH